MKSDFRDNMSRSPLRPAPVTLELAVILQSHVCSDIIVRANISATVQIYDAFIIVLAVKRDRTEHSKENSDLLHYNNIATADKTYSIKMMQ